MALSASEIIRIVGRRQSQTSVYDSVAIIPATAKFQMTDPPIAIPIPTTSDSTGIDTKMIALRRVTMKVTITGVIQDGSDGFSATGVTVNASTGSVTSGTPVTSVLKKKWILEEMFKQGAVGKGMTMQYRNIITPITSTSPPTPPTSETQNVWHEMGKIIDLSITDSIKNAPSPQSSVGDRYLPEYMNITIVIQWGSVQS